MALLVCLAGAACDGSLAVSQSTQAIVGGTEDTGDPAVVAILPRRQACEDHQTLPMCSGTLISPRVVLTAAHCVRDLVVYGSLEVFFGSNTLDDPQGTFVVVGKTLMHPSYDRSSKDFDIALLQLVEVAPVAPVALATTPLDASSVGMPVRAVGWGVTAAALQPDGKRRQGTLTISTLAQVTFQAVPGPAMTCAGDSGGPLFATLGGVEQLVGVTSAGDPACENFAVNARVDQFITDFVQPFVDAAAIAPVGPSPTGMAAEQICASTCKSNDDCPSVLACQQTAMTAQCFLNGAGAGNWGAACTTRADCPAGATMCGRLYPNACRCFTPCVMLPPPPMPKGKGCAMAPSGPPGTLVALAIGLLALALRRRQPAGGVARRLGHPRRR